jgi:hypothetical protein
MMQIGIEVMGLFQQFLTERFEHSGIHALQNEGIGYGYFNASIVVDFHVPTAQYLAVSVQQISHKLTRDLSRPQFCGTGDGNASKPAGITDINHQLADADEGIFEIEDDPGGADPAINSPSQFGAPPFNQFDTMVSG